MENVEEQYFDITIVLVIFTFICFFFWKIPLIQVFGVTIPRYNEQISPVPWHFVKSRFHCISSALGSGMNFIYSKLASFKNH